MLQFVFFLLGIMIGLLAAFFFRSLTAAPETPQKAEQEDADDWSDEESDDD
jgi:peptidyl-tRNA hydrolase, PTH2 family